MNGEIDAFKQNGRWLSSAGCADATATKSMSYCEGFFKLKAELALPSRPTSSKRRSELGTRSANSIPAAARATDPQSQMLASLTGRSTEEIQMGLTVLIALLVELGASLGFYTAFSYWRIFDVKGLPAPSRCVWLLPCLRSRPLHAPGVPGLDPELRAAQPKTDVELYFDERVGRENGSSVTALALYDDYCQWCEAKGKQPLGLPIFTRRFSDLGVQKAKVAGRIRYMDVRLLFGTGEDGLGALRGVLIGDLPHPRRCAAPFHAAAYTE